MTIAEALEAERASLGLSINELAKRAEVRYSVCHDILAGATRNPGILTVAKLLAALDQSLPWLDRQIRRKVDHEAEPRSDSAAPRMGSPKLKAYFLPNGDGQNHFLVATSNQREACKLLNVAIGYFRRYGGRVVGGMTADIALSEPGRVWKQKSGCNPQPQPWIFA